MTNQLLIFFISALGIGIGAAAAWFTFKHSAPPKGDVKDSERQDALERFKTWNEFWKYFLVSFALVLITTLLGNTLKERELRMQESKQAADLALETAKTKTASLIAENQNLGSFLDRALSEDWRKQYAFASYFSHLTADAQAQKRWEDYATFIVRTRTETATLEEESGKMNAKIAAIRKKDPQDSQLPELERQLSELRTRLEVNQAVLEPRTAMMSRFQATKQQVNNRGAPPDSFLSELITWGKTAPDDIFADDAAINSEGIYASLEKQLGPWQGPLHRRAVMLEVMRVLAGFESNWNWNEGPDFTNAVSGNPNLAEAGAWQVTASTMAFGSELQKLVLTRVGTVDPVDFQRSIKADHSFAMEYVARLLRRSSRFHGALVRHAVDPWLRRDAVEEFKSFIGDDPKKKMPDESKPDLFNSTPSPHPTASAKPR